MRSSLFFYFFIITPFSFLWGQTKTPMRCGHISSQTDISRLLANKARDQKASLRDNEVKYLPIQFHLVANSNGGGRIPESKVLDGLCKLNEDFQNTNLQFYFNGTFKYIDSDVLFDLNYPNITSAASSLFTTNRVVGNVNIFIGNQLSSGNSGFYTSNRDIIYMDKSYVNDNDNILAHELGHFLSLPHTFLGWEETTYDPSKPTPTQVFRGNTAYDVEYVDRNKNCESSGDYFCGTPADYIWDWNGGCDYAGGAVDPDSVLIDPDETNIMAYYSFSGCTEYGFSEDQKGAMYADFLSRSSILANSIDPGQSIEKVPAPVSPVNEVEVHYENVELVWEEVANAFRYTVEISRQASLFALDVYEVTEHNKLTINSLRANKKYYWRINAFSQTDQCNILSSEVGIFRTIEMTSSVQNHKIKGVSIFPNVLDGSNAMLNISTDKSLQILPVYIYDSDGILVFSKKINPSPLNITVLKIPELAGGFYFLKLDYEGTLVAYKIVIL